MSLKGLLKYLAFYIEKKQNPIFSGSIQKNMEYLNSFKEPKSLDDRSFYQYKCQMLPYGRALTALINIASMPLVVYYLLKRYQAPNRLLDGSVAVFLRDNHSNNILPNSLREKYETIVFDPIEGMYLSHRDKEFIFDIIKLHPFSWHYVLKGVIKIARYRYVIDEYCPQAMIVCAEYSFSSSLLTKYCNELGIAHIDVMHGEKLLTIRDSFFEYNSCYVWDDHYIKLFEKLRAANNQFVVELPPSMDFKDKKYICNKYDYVYYLTNEDNETLERIVHIMEHLSKNNRVAVRPHPIYTKYDDLKRICGDKIFIEDNKLVTIEESILQTSNVVALFSTVLNQACHNNVSIIIDDICDEKKYQKLKELDYLCLSKEHKLLSQII